MLLLVIFAWIVSVILFLGGGCAVLLSALLLNRAKVQMIIAEEGKLRNSVSVDASDFYIECAEIDIERYIKGIRHSFYLFILGLLGIIGLVLQVIF